jgi:hypothetical protein
MFIKQLLAFGLALGIVTECGIKGNFVINLRLSRDTRLNGNSGSKALLCLFFSDYI